MYQLHLHNAPSWGPQRRIEIYAGFDSPSIIKYLEPMTGDVFRARFADCHFNETVFLQLGRGGGGGGGGGGEVDPRRTT